MRTFFVLICSAALACVASGEKTATEKATRTEHAQHTATHSVHSTGGSTHGHHTEAPHNPGTAGGHPRTGGGATKPGRERSYPNSPAGDAAAKPAASAPSTPIYHYNFRTPAGVVGRDFSRPLTSDEQSTIARQLENGPAKGTHGATAGYDSEGGIYHYDFRTKSGLVGRDFTKPLTAEEQSAIARELEKGQPQATQRWSGVASNQAKAVFRPQHFSLPDKPNPAIVGVKFEGNGHIPGSETWTDPRYAAFHDYHHEWHDKNWWEHHPNPIHCPNPQFFRPVSRTPHRVTVLVYGGWYRWYAGYWYPAWGYDSQNEYYPYDGPIYAYNGLAPDQVIANVQTALQALGYYNGPINGILDSATRAAIATYQQDHGLYITSAIDESTLAVLGMS